MLSEVKFDLSLISSDSLIMSGISLMVVFLGLTVLWLSFEAITMAINYKPKKTGEKAEAKYSEQEISGDVTAAIATALSLYFNDMHDDEKTVITMLKVSKTYSPWSSKIYNVMKFRNVG